MFALQARPCAVLTAPALMKTAARKPARRVTTCGQEQAMADFECPLLRSAPCKTSCVHPGRPLSSACADCPRKQRAKAMAKKTCVHPKRPISQACADCPRKK
ncbi:hypothetical protein D9Q98_009479 [Chlorella vulgaris]|uniref:Uncharacterized protein n=1 Tax=Chlorella vulgaris TaxID=3077 RepID=A0A9D4YSK1_CHLVU|nr:hypothetical protein D9Q98_009479 [Chlorella vulgaris]